MALQQDTKNKTAVLAFGRMNPPTTGHEKLINKTHEVAKQHGGTAHVVASHSNDKKKNPLPQDKKLGYIRKIAHPDVNVSGSSTGSSGPLHAATKLHDAGHKHLVYVGGSDQHKNIHKVLTKYNGKKGPHGHYNFKSIKSVSAGDRDDKASGTQGMSASKMRDHAKAGRHKEFKQGLPKALHPHAKEIHGHIGGTQLESFKEAMMKKRFKPSGDKTEVITHTMPPSTGGGKGSVGSSGGKGAPANTARSGGTRFGEGANRYMRMVNAEFEDFTGGSLDEVLSRQARIKKALILRRFKHKIQRKKAIMRKKLATPDMIKRRARRHAIKLVRIRFMGKKGKDYAKLGMADKIMIDTRVATKKKIIDRIAQRLLPKVRRAELVRLRTMNKKKVAPKQKIKKMIQAPKRPSAPSPQKFVPLKPTTSNKATSSYTIPTNVKTEEVMSIVDMLSILTEKDQKALENKINSSDIDNDILFEVFAMGLEGEGPQTPQQQGFMSLNTFIADNYKSAALAEQRENKIIEAEEEYQELVRETMSEWDGEVISGVQLDRRYNRPIVTKSSLPRLKEFKATGENSSVEDPIDPKTVVHDIIDKDNNKIKKKKKAKEVNEIGDAYQKSKHHGKRSYDDWSKHSLASSNVATLKRKIHMVPPNKEKIPEWKQQLTKWEAIKKKYAVEALSYPHETAKQYKKDTPGQRDEDLQATVKKVKVLGFLAKQKLKQKARQAKAKMSTPKPNTQYAEYDMNAMFIEALLGDKDIKKDQDDHVKGAVKYVKRQEYNLNRRIKRVTNKVLQTKTGGVQNEDAAALMRVARAQQGQKERMRDQHNREMEDMDNSEAKAKKREAFVKSMAGLKARQQQRKDTARARPGTGLRTSTSRVGMDKGDPKYGKGKYSNKGSV